jgi:hypothetical protein
MEFLKRVSYIVSAMAVSGLLVGCFSYHREVRETSTPAVTTPDTSSTTTTTTTNDNGTVQRQTTTTYGNP